MKREGVESNFARNPVEELTSFADIEAFYQAMAEAYGEDSEYAENIRYVFYLPHPRKACCLLSAMKRKL